MKTIFLSLLICFGFQAIYAEKTQARPAYLDEQSDIFLVGEVKPGETYPLIVFLPFTTGSADDFYNSVKDLQTPKTFIALIPKGVTERDHYLPDFMAFIGWYEKRVLADIELAKKKFPVDAQKIFMEGYSLGGDLGWAFMIRHKTIFKGAIMFGTRTSYGASTKDLTELKKLDKKFVFAIGESDASDRIAGMKKAVALVEKAKISFSFEYIKNAGHSFTLSEDFWKRAWKLFLE